MNPRNCGFADSTTFLGLWKFQFRWFVQWFMGKSKSALSLTSSSSIPSKLFFYLLWLCLWEQFFLFSHLWIKKFHFTKYANLTCVVLKNEIFRLLNNFCILAYLSFTPNYHKLVIFKCNFGWYGEKTKMPFFTVERQNALPHGVVARSRRTASTSLSECKRRQRTVLSSPMPFIFPFGPPKIS